MSSNEIWPEGQDISDEASLQKSRISSGSAQPTRLSTWMGSRKRRSFAGLTLFVALIAAVICAALDYPHSLSEAIRYQLSLRTAPVLTAGNELQMTEGDVDHVQQLIWERVPLPEFSGYLTAFAAAPDNSSATYACGVLQSTRVSPSPSAVVPGRVVLWKSGAAGSEWTSLPNLDTQGISCQIMIAQDTPTAILISVARPPRQDHTCTSEQLFLTKDGGSHWRQIPDNMPMPSSDARNCAISTWIAGAHVYTWIDFERSPSTNSTDGIGHLFARSDDGGFTWRVLPVSVGPMQLSRPTQLRAAASLVSIVPIIDSKGTTETQLWATGDSGESWYLLARLHDVYAPNIAVQSSAHVTSLKEAIPLYLFGRLNRVDGHEALQVIQITSPEHWQTVPAPDVRASQSAIVRVLGTATDGELIVLGLEGVGGSEGQRNDVERHLAAHLWTWDSQRSRWRDFASELPETCPSNFTDCWLTWLSLPTTGDQHESTVWIAKTAGSPSQLHSIYWARVSTGSA